MKYRHLLATMLFFSAARSTPAQTLPGTKPLDMKGDLARVMLDGIDKYLTRAVKEADAQRKADWKYNYGSPEKFSTVLEPKRERLKKILGIVDGRLPLEKIEYLSTIDQPALIAETDSYKVYSVRWPVLPGVFGEGLLLEPKGKAKACVVAIPDADQTPERLVFPPDNPRMSFDGQFARELAELGCRVVILELVDRSDRWSGNPKLKRFTNQPHREFVYRMAYEMGRHPIGYETQKVLAVVDWFARDKDHPPIGVYGYGEGGLIAWMSAALDTRINTTCIGGYFGPHADLADEPIYRNVWGILKEFGPEELAALIAPRRLIQEFSSPPPVKGPPKARDGWRGAAPGKLTHVLDIDRDREKLNALENLWKPLRKGSDDSGYHSFAWKGVTFGFSASVLATAILNPKEPLRPNPTQPKDARREFDFDLRQKRQVEQLVDFTQKLLPEAARKRDDLFWSKLDTSSIEKFQKSQAPLREYFHDEIIGRLPEPTMPLNARSRLIYETDKWKGYEVVLDVYEDVISYGILLVPNGIKPGEKRPCVVCQHGLEGRPTDVCNPKETTRAYNSYGAKLADQGFVVFAPQNPYIFENDFRQVVRKANPLKLTLYAFIYRQHQRILEFLGTLDFVDARRIAYYGLSYGGKVAMRIPALLLGYCAVICSGDFNEWIWKNITLDWAGSYMFSREYEMYEFDLGNTFNYAEMAALIAPRPFMVERGHNDGVGLDEYVAFEYAKVRRLYAKLGIADRTEIEFFRGGHEINLRGTLAFLRRHLDWPVPKE